MAAFYGPRDGLLTAGLLAATGAPLLVGAHVTQHLRPRLGGLSRQFAVGVGVSVGLALLSVAIVAALLFVSPHDAFTLALMLAFVGVLGVYAALPLAMGVMSDVERVRDALRAVGEGERDLRIATQGSDEIAELAEAGNMMIEQLESRERERDVADAARRNLVAAVSHDLRTPLSSLRVLAEAIEGEVADAEARRGYAAQLSVHIQALGGLIDDLFELSRIEAGEIEWSMETLRLDALVEETVDAMRAQAVARGITTRADVPDDLPPARANPEKVQRVLFNLIQNAIRHTPPDGTITVVAEGRGEHVEIEVADTGSGIDPEDRERVFEPFYRGGQSAARSRGGAGLGLTICRAIVEAHGGEIELVDGEHGTRVRFTLPRAGTNRGELT